MLSILPVFCSSWSLISQLFKTLASVLNKLVSLYHVPQRFLLSGKVQEFSYILAFFNLHSVVSWSSKIYKITRCVIILINNRSVSSARIWGSVRVSKSKIIILFSGQWWLFTITLFILPSSRGSKFLRRFFVASSPQYIYIFHSILYCTMISANLL